MFCPPGKKPEQHRKVGIWSHWPIRLLDTPPSVWRGSAAAIVDTPFGKIVVYGSVIAYGGERQHLDGRPATSWEVHASEIERQSSERSGLVKQGRPVVVAGDFNQARDPRSTRGYGTNAVRSQLTGALDASGNKLSDHATVAVDLALA